MKLKIVCLVVLCFAICGSTEARKKNKKKSKVDIVLVEAYTQRTLPGVRCATPPPATTHIIIVWEDMNFYPESFLWIQDTGLVYTCNFAKAHKVVEKSFRIPQGMDYITEQIKGGDVHKG